jgi:hypothetical protein
VSRAQERKAMREALAGYSLMGIPELASFLGCSEDVARGLVDRREIPSVPVGGRQKVDPMDAAVHVLAGREGMSAEEYWDRHGEATADHVRRYVARIRKAIAGAAA